MRRLALLVACSGCQLYFGDHGGPPPDARAALPDASIVDGPPANELALPCIHAVAANVVVDASAVIAYSCTGGSILADLAYQSGALATVDPRADWGYQFASFRPANIDGYPPLDMLAFPSSGPFYGTSFFDMSTGGRDFASISGTQEFVDADTGDLDGDGTLDLVLAGGSGLGAILDDTNLTDGFESTTEVPLASGAFSHVAIAGSMVFYVATAADGSLQLGTATRTSTQPLAYTLATAATAPAGTVLPLLVADLDGDGQPDVVGGVPNVFMWLSSTQSVSMFADQSAKAIAVGDLGAGNSIVFAPTDGSGLRRVDVSLMSPVTVSHWTDDDADLIQLADVDGDGTLDAILVHDLNQPTSTITVHFSP
jgi:hypothetical protein